MEQIGADLHTIIAPDSVHTMLVRTTGKGQKKDNARAFAKTQKQFH